jgi:hypothetical protein
MSLKNISGLFGGLEKLLTFASPYEMREVLKAVEFCLKVRW